MIRKIHLDFHTHPETQGIGRGFDPEAFAETLAEAHVNLLATPGKCHFGNLYYASEISRTHPHLDDPEMFPRTVAACHARGIAVQAYWTLGLDAWAAEQHPAWRQRFADGRYGSWGHYLHMCFASDYIDDLVIPELRECMERCPGLAGFWFDISLYVDGAFYSDAFEARARAAGASDDIARWWLARDIIRERCAQINAAIHQQLPDADNYFNSLVNPGEARNLPREPVHEVENPLLFQSAEKLSSDGRWLRAQGGPTVGLVSRFQGPWSDPGTLRTADQMRFDVARAIALGEHVSMGDHRYPDGHLEPEVYRRLAPIYADVEALEPWLEQATLCREALLLAPVVGGSGKGHLVPGLSPSTRQVVRLLEELGLQVDIVTIGDAWPEADLIIWPGETAGDAALLRRLREHVDRGGALLACHHALATPGAEAFFGTELLPWRGTDATGSDDLGAIGHVGGGSDAADVGPAEHYLRLRPQLGGEPFSQLFTRPMRCITAAADATVLADRIAPISTKPPFPGSEPAGPAIVQRGRVIAAAPDLFGEAVAGGSPSPVAAIESLINRLLPRRQIRHDAGPTVAAHCYRLPDGLLVHLVHWAMDRWPGQVNSARRFPRLGPIAVTVAVDAPVTGVTLEPSGEAIDYTAADGSCTCSFSGLHIWQVIRFSTTNQPSIDSSAS